MTFNSLLFILFLAVVFVLDRCTSTWTLRKVWLLIASLLFYAAWFPPYLVLLMIPTVTDWYAARLIATSERPAVRRAILVTSLCLTLGLLAFFKYAAFLADTTAALAQAAGLSVEAPRFSILLPVGISFYTFQTISYTVDVYRRRIAPARTFLDYALYVAFFPQLVAGPIVRAEAFLPQCESSRRANAAQIGWGVTLLVLGLFHKVVVADGILAPVVDRIFAVPGRVGFAEAWVGSLGFASQAFFDFAGYSSCAIGTAMMLGWSLPDNFRFPFAALGIADFWRRWHISLSTWLRDYLYIPLGGSRLGPVRTQINLMITMLLGGLWHGAAWKYIVWGGLHGSFLCLERTAQSRLGLARLADGTWGRAILWTATFLLLSITWPVFRSADLEAGWGMIASMLSPFRENVVGLSSLRMATAAAAVIGLFLLHGLMRRRVTEEVWGRMAWPVRTLLIAAMLVALMLVPGDSRAFIYFQF